MYRKKVADVITCNGPDGAMYIDCVESGAGFKVGDVVRLNNHGIWMVNGLSDIEEVAQQVSGAKIVEMLSDSHAVPGVFPVTLEGKLGQYLIDTNCIERV